MKKVFLIFLVSLVLNFVWENLHSLMYKSYMGGKITELILFRASIVDAIIITLICVPFIYFAFLRKMDWLIIFCGIIVAIIIEQYGLGSGRWEYDLYMPIVPIISVGLSPVLQLGLTGYLSYRLS